MRHVERQRSLDDERDRTVAQGLRGEVVTVAALAGYAEEQRARRHLAAVVREARDLDARDLGARDLGAHCRGARAAEDLQAGNQLCEPHLSGLRDDTTEV